MRKYKVGDVIKFKDLSDVTEGFTKDCWGIPANILQLISGSTATIRIIEGQYETLFRVDGCNYIFDWNDVEQQVLITPEQKNHILQLIREI